MFVLYPPNEKGVARINFEQTLLKWKQISIVILIEKLFYYKNLDFCKTTEHEECLIKYLMTFPKDSSVLLAENNSLMLKELLIKCAIRETQKKEVIVLFLKYIWDVNKKIECGKFPQKSSFFPLELAFQTGNLETMRIVLQCGAHIRKSDWLDIIEKNDLKRMKLLLENKADLNQRDEKGFYPLHWALRLNNRKMFQFFLEHGANPNVVDKEGYFLLHWVVQRRNVKMVECLIKHGAVISNKNFFGKTALEMAIEIRQHPGQNIRKIDKIISLLQPATFTLNSMNEDSSEEMDIMR